MGIMMFGPTLLEYGSEEQKQYPHPVHLQRRDPLVPGLFRAGRRLRPRGAADPLRGQGRPLPGQRPEDLDLRRPVRRLVLLPGAHRPSPPSTRASRFILFDMKTPGVEVRPIKLISGNLALLRDLLDRREGAEGEPGRRAEQGLDHRQAAAQHERNSLSGGGGSAGRFAGDTRPLDKLARDYIGTDETGPDRRTRTCARG
jgi:hypothetical protein